MLPSADSFVVCVGFGQLPPPRVWCLDEMLSSAVCYNSVLRQRCGNRAIYPSGEDYPLPMVCHTDASRINVERMRQIYSRLLGYKGHKGELIGK